MLNFSVEGRQNSYVTVCRWIFRATEILLGPKHLCHNLMTKKKKKRRRSKLICWVARTYAWLSLFACIIFFSYKFSPQIKKAVQVWDYLQKDYEVLFKSNRFSTCYTFLPRKRAARTWEVVALLFLLVWWPVLFVHVHKVWSLKGVRWVDCSLLLSRNNILYLFSIVIYKILNLFCSCRRFFHSYTGVDQKAKYMWEP